MEPMVLTGYVYAHDPVIVREGGVYYRLNTGPGVPISVSDDLHHWELAGRALKAAPQWIAQKVSARKAGSVDFWAPDVVRRGGMWRMYYSASTFGSNTSAIGLAACATLADAVNGQFVDMGCVIASSEASPYNCIDPQVFTREDGKDYLLFGSFWGGLFAVPLDAQGMVEKGSVPQNIARRWKRSTNGDSGFDTNIATQYSTQPPCAGMVEKENPIEGGYIYCHEGRYYLFASHDYCCRGTASTYHIVVGASSGGALGPYMDKAGVPMLDGGGVTLRDGATYKRWAGPGHCSVFKDIDETEYLVYHAYDRQNNGRQTLQIERINWVDGWPVVGSE